MERTLLISASARRTNGAKKFPWVVLENAQISPQLPIKLKAWLVYTLSESLSGLVLLMNKGAKTSFN